VSYLVLEQTISVMCATFGFDADQSLRHMPRRHGRRRRAGHLHGRVLPHVPLPLHLRERRARPPRLPALQRALARAAVHGAAAAGAGAAHAAAATATAGAHAPCTATAYEAYAAAWLAATTPAR